MAGGDQHSMCPSPEEPLSGGHLTASVTRRGEAVRRTAGPWAPAVHAWLAHLAATTPGIAPAPLGLDPDRTTELVTYIPGEVPLSDPPPAYLWRDDTLAAVARLIRRFHDAAKSFQTPSRATWSPAAAYPGGGQVICHNDLAPWNTVFRDEQPTAFIDWDLAAPGPRLWDVVFSLWHFVPLYGDPDTDPFGVDMFEPRAARTRLFCDAYGLADRGDVVDMLAKRQRAVYDAFKSGHAAGDPAYVRLWEMGAGDGIERQIGYVARHRGELEHALA